MNKSNVISFLAALIFAACTSTPKSYIIEGVVPDESYNNQMVYLYDYATRKNTDSALVVDGKFRFTGSVDTAVIRRLEFIVLNRLAANIILENGKILVNMADPESTKGTMMNVERSKFRTEIESLFNDFRERYLEIEKQQDIDEETRQNLYDENIEQYKILIGGLIEKIFSSNKNNALGTFVLFSGWNYMEPDHLDNLYAQAGDIVRGFIPLHNIIETNAIKRQTAAGMPFVDFAIENGNRDGSKASFSDYVGRGKYVLVDFWASWCGPCIAEIPVLVEVYNKYKGDKFEVLGVAVWDKREESLKSLDSHSIPWPQIIDASDIPTNLYGISGIPHIILFGPDGKIIARDLRGNQLKAKVAEVMQ